MPHVFFYNTNVDKSVNKTLYGNKRLLRHIINKKCDNIVVQKMDDVDMDVDTDDQQSTLAAQM